MTESAEKNFPAYSHLPKYSPEGLKHDGNQVGNNTIQTCD